MITRAGKVFLLNFFWLNGEGRKKKSRRLIRTLRCLSDKTGTNTQVAGGSRLMSALGQKQISGHVRAIRFTPQSGHQNWPASSSAPRLRHLGDIHRNPPPLHRASVAWRVKARRF
jgi:hypothetical protein